ncbi:MULTISPECIES: MarR family winged helix-turn-helix transcriptional regulator [Protofrankia]|uniref:Regulatory protein MarR n=2 Tax=Candidatus Protofrankia datiscae TaxID=2716812 RepID=F8AZH5_9ACTN|nr:MULTISPECIES: MarR family transcriptional regulator [Protofrankia]AEH08650.1 regulatory protein MarR [Candidatus Protofrankia datiscae]
MEHSDARETSRETSKAMSGSRTGTASATELPEEVHEDLGWLLTQVLNGFLDAAQETVGDFPGGLRGLHVLSATANGCSRNQLEVARRLGIDRSVMVRLIDDLERGGLVKRCPDPADRRARLIRPTDTGLRQHEEMTARLDVAKQQVLAPLSIDEQESLTAMLRRVVIGLLPAGQSPEPCLKDAETDQKRSRRPA